MSKVEQYMDKLKQWRALEENDAELAELAGEMDDLWWELTDDERSQVEKQTQEISLAERGLS